MYRIATTNLIRLVVAIVIAEEGMECAQLLPSEAQLFVARAVEPAHITSNIGYAKQIEFHGTDYGRLQVLPACGIIAEPVASVTAARRVG